MNTKNQQLEDLFNLPDIKPGAEIKKPTKEIAPTPDTLSTIEKINNALPSVKGLDASDKEMDDLAIMATEAYKDLFDLGCQVDSRSAGDILSQASNFLGHAITARTAKMNKKLKMIDMQLKKMRLDQTGVTKETELEETSGTVFDRNALIEQILKQQK